MKGDIIESDKYEISGFLDPYGRFWNMDERYEEGLTQHEDFAEYIINLKGYEKNTRSAKDYLINMGWVAVSVMYCGNIEMRRLTYNTKARQNKNLEDILKDYREHGYTDDYIGEQNFENLR